uniref:DNA -binding domain-containing protein n=1 Tax=Sphingomonas sp. Ant H11 TaxID=1564113 RepID=UPI00053F1A81
DARPSRRNGAFRPTAFQRRRLDLLLDILDMLLTPPSAPRPTSHEIARRLIYPGMTIGRGMEWKSSTERRRTQRLINEALALMHGGYRALLRGVVGGRQKSAA